MGLLNVDHLSQGFGEKQLYQEAAFEVFKGEHVGIVGQNGAGKSTLIQILTGEVVPDDGNVNWQQGIRIGHLDQYAQLDPDITIRDYLKTAFAALYMAEQEMLACYERAAAGEGGLLEKAARLQEQLIAQDFYGADHRVQRVATGLGLDAVGLDKQVGQLSGGQRAKVILAKILLDAPDVLLLDEPTNFLDKEHVKWLAETLAGFEGAFLVVSHDFDFLEQITTAILDIEFGTVKKYHGSYSQFLQQKVHLREDYIRQYQAQRRHIEKTEAYIRKNKAGVNAKMARGRQKQLDRMERIAPPSFVEKPVFRFQEVDLPVQKALQVKHLEVGYYFPLLPGLSFNVESGQKLVVTGFNGIGKSTLLKTLVGQLPPIGGSFAFNDQVRIGYYEQDLVWESPGLTPLQIMSQWYPGKTTKELRRALAQCGVKAEHVGQAVHSLSGGEQSKVKLCRLMLSPCNFLILDEPTNHLDLETKEVLGKALEQFHGSVLLVSHEEKFYRGLADKIFPIESRLK